MIGIRKTTLGANALLLFGAARLDAQLLATRDTIVTAPTRAPLYKYIGEPDVQGYLDANAAAKVTLEHLVRPAADAAGNPYHYVIVHVDGDKFSMEVIGVDRGRDFAPYRSNAVTLYDPKP